MRRDKREAANKRGKIIKIIVLIIIIILMALLVWLKAPDYYVKEVKDKTNLVINNNNVTSKMKDDVYIDSKGVIYLSINDVKNYFDKYINYDESSNRLITTSDTKIATLIKDKKNIDISNVYRYLKSLINFLDGCDSMLDEIAEYESDMRAEYEAEMSSYMVW